MSEDDLCIMINEVALVKNTGEGVDVESFVELMDTAPWY